MDRYHELKHYTLLKTIIVGEHQRTPYRKQCLINKDEYKAINYRPQFEAIQIITKSHQQQVNASTSRVFYSCQVVGYEQDSERYSTLMRCPISETLVGAIEALWEAVSLLL